RVLIVQSLAQVVLIQRRIVSGHGAAANEMWLDSELPEKLPARSALPWCEIGCVHELVVRLWADPGSAYVFCRVLREPRVAFGTLQRHEEIVVHQADERRQP